MITIKYFTDSHFRDSKPKNRIDDFCEVQLRKLKYIMDYKVDKLGDENILLCGGDFFDEPYISHQLVNDILRINKSSQKFLSIIGNHDTIGYNSSIVNQTALGTLIAADYVGLLDKELSRDGDRVIRIDGIHTRKHFSFDQYKELAKATADIHIIVNHDILSATPMIFEYIPLEDIYECLKGSKKQYYVLCSHYHPAFEKKIGNVTFINPGCFTRQTLHEEKYVPQFVIISTDGKKISHKYVKVPCEKNVFVSVKHDALEVEKDSEKFIEQLKGMSFEQHNLSQQVRVLAKNFDVSQNVVDELVKRIEKEQLVKT